MLNRIRQFVQALGAQETFADQMYVRQALEPEEAGLFFAMTKLDRCHSLRVARDALRLARGRGFDEQLLVKAALLHDVGKGGEVPLWYKVGCVLLESLAPGYAQNLADKDAPRGSLRRALYVYFNHGALGAEKLEALGSDWRIVWLAANHHATPEKVLVAELSALQEADGLN